MLCSEKELGLSNDGEGIIVLENNVADKLGGQISDVLNKNDKINTNKESYGIKAERSIRSTSF